MGIETSPDIKDPFELKKEDTTSVVNEIERNFIFDHPGPVEVECRTHYVRVVLVTREPRLGSLFVVVQTLAGRKNEQYYLTLPGGGVLSNEDPIDALVRELYEEIGIQFPSKRFLYTNIYPTYHTVEKYPLPPNQYLLRKTLSFYYPIPWEPYILEKTPLYYLNPVLGPEISEMNWMPASRLVENIHLFPNQRRTIARMLKLFHQAN